jgi:hypothetical protein
MVVVLVLVPVAALLVSIIGAAAAVVSDTDYNSASTAALIGQRQRRQQQQQQEGVLLLQQQWPPAAPATASLASSSSHGPINTAINASTAPWYPFDGVGGLSGGGATSTFLMAYSPEYRSEIMDWMFKPGFASSLNILKVEIGCDDETTDGCESCHMRSPTDLNCSRGYEWDLMKAAVARNPGIVLYGLPWGFAGWLGFGTTNPYHNVTATADYIAKCECLPQHRNV